jgi:hypothetical protein
VIGEVTSCVNCLQNNLISCDSKFDSKRTFFQVDSYLFSRLVVVVVVAVVVVVVVDSIKVDM